MRLQEKKKIAIVVPCVHEGGGVPAVAEYLHNILEAYEPTIISISTSRKDPFSMRILDPASWTKGVRAEPGEWKGRQIVNVGACGTEFEFQRYMPRRVLTAYLNRFDLIQVVAGAPAWAYVTRHVQKPVCLQVATLVREERKRLLGASTGARKIWLRLMTAITSRLEEHALKFVDRVFVENHWMYERMRQRLGETRTVFAIPGIDTSIYKPRPKNTLSGPHARPFIISVGRLSDSRKNVPLLLQAYARLIHKLPTAPDLVLLGITGPSAQDWRLAEELGIRKRILCKLDVPVGELVAFLQHAECFVCSSDEEGLGIAMLEAMACGIPVVSTRCGGPETFIRHGDNGFLVPLHDAAAMADHIYKLLSTPGLQAAMGERAGSDVEKFYSMQATRSKFTRAYSELLGAGAA